MAAPTFVTGDVPTATQVNNWFVNIGYVRKPSTETRSNTVTVADDTHLILNVDASTAYEVRLNLFIASQTANDFKIGFAGPSGATLDAGVWSIDPGATGYTGTETAPLTMGSTLGIGGLGGNNVPVLVEGLLVVSSTAGQFKLQWSQNTTGASGSSVLVGSYMILRRVG